jgi:hypothetical protein
LITVANGVGLPGGATAGCGVPGATPEAGGLTPAAATGRPVGAAPLAALAGLLAALAAGGAAAGASDAQPPSSSNAAGSALRTRVKGTEDEEAGARGVMGCAPKS